MKNPFSDDCNCGSPSSIAQAGGELGTTNPNPLRWVAEVGRCAGTRMVNAVRSHAIEYREPAGLSVRGPQECGKLGKAHDWDGGLWGVRPRASATQGAGRARVWRRRAGVQGFGRRQ